MITEGGTGKTQERLQGQSPCLGPGPDQDLDQEIDPEIDLHVSLTAPKRGTQEVLSVIKKLQPVLAVMTDPAPQLTLEHHPAAIRG